MYYNTDMALLLAKNRKALFEHQLVEKYVAGVVLRGYEVKALREGNVSFEGSYVQVIDNKPCVINLYIGRYSKMGRPLVESEERRRRDLLLNKKEIADIARSLDEKGRTAVPLALVVDHNIIKMEFAVVKGLKEYEKKHIAQAKQVDKDMAREAKSFGLAG